MTAVVVLATLAGAAYLYVPRPIRPAGERTGDAALLAQLGEPAGHRRLAVAMIDLGEQPVVRFAGIGATPDTRFEAGSLTKAMTGLVLADAARRGEVDLAAPVSTYLDLGDSVAGQVTLQELATHHAGYPRLGGRTLFGGLLSNYTAGNPYGADRAQLLDEVRSAKLTDRGTYAYSNLGAATAGQALAGANRTDYRSLMAARLFGPLGMASTEVADRPLVEPGLTAKGRTSAPWVMGGYAPAGGVVTTAGDLTTLATALLRGSAPGMSALTPLTDAGGHRSIGLFWIHSSEIQGQPVDLTWHNGATGGYTSFVGLDRKAGKAVVVLSDTANDVDDLGVRLLLGIG